MKVAIIALLFIILGHSCDDNNANVNNDIGIIDIKWSYLRPQIFAFGDVIQPVIENDVSYIASDTSLVCREVSSGEEKWRVGLNNDRSISSLKLLHTQDKVFFNQDQYVTAFSKEGGAVVWRTEIQSIHIRDLTAMDQNDTHLFIGGSGGVIRLDKETGSVDLMIPINKLNGDEGSQGSRVVTIHNNDTLIVPYSYYEPSMPEIGGFVFCYNAQTGEEIWSYEVPNRYWVNGSGDSLLTGAGVKKCAIINNLVAFHTGHSVFALDRISGEKVWETFFPDNGFTDESISADNGIIFTGSTLGIIYGMDATDGKILWDVNIQYTFSSLFTPEAGRLYFANPMGGGLWIIDQLNGEVIWNGQPPEFETDDNYVYFSPVAVGNDYMINVGSRKVYCLSVP